MKRLIAMLILVICGCSDVKPLALEKVNISQESIATSNLLVDGTVTLNTNTNFITYTGAVTEFTTWYEAEDVVFSMPEATNWTIRVEFEDGSIKEYMITTNGIEQALGGE